MGPSIIARGCRGCVTRRFLHGARAVPQGSGAHARHTSSTPTRSCPKLPLSNIVCRMEGTPYEPSTQCTRVQLHTRQLLRAYTNPGRRVCSPVLRVMVRWTKQTSNARRDSGLASAQDSQLSPERSGLGKFGENWRPCSPSCRIHVSWGRARARQAMRSPATTTSL